ncbi:hypothetical protein [uncultured Neptuniibacter sp.]|uniref:hypothetical protein n=1 Tax=uncultured Neptuniibacter sp. TaxID=502143 RepID=UPI0026146001|nr:hypothetical protein [uncultured Neptuniibacter sp.]
MTNEYRPLFNRKYISGLMWFSLLAILILSTMGPGEVEFYPVESNRDKTVYWMELDEQPITLTLLLPTGEAINSTQRQLQQLKSHIIQSRLQKFSSPNYSYSVIPRQDRIEITFGWNQQHVPELDAIWDSLTQPIETSQWQAELKNIQARHYLSSQTPDQMVAEQFFIQLQPDTGGVLDQLPAAYHRMFQAPRYAISGDSADELVSLVEKQLPQHSSAQQRQKPIPTRQQSITEVHEGANYRLLIGRSISARNSELYIEERITAHLLQQLLTQQQSQHKVSFRLLWAALETTGYQAFILEGRSNPGPMLSQLQQQVTEELVEVSQKQLAEQWHERMRDLANQTQALNLIAFYSLPEDTMENYTDQILDQDPDEIIIAARKALQTNEQISILHTPAL